MVKNMKFILVAKTMQAFAYLFFVNEQCNAASLSAWVLCPAGL